MLTRDSRGALARAALLGPLCVLAVLSPGVALGQEADPSSAVVKVYSAAIVPSHAEPWRPGQSVSYTGSGAVIEGGRVLTNAHVVEAHTYVQVRPNGSPEKYPARVAFVSHVADLALLEVVDPEFHEQVEVLPFGGLPAVRDEVSALGFPLGGDTLSVTDGVVSRVEHELYVHSWESLLSIQMDAAIGPGSSGGPLVQDGRLVGIAMQGLSESALGCAIPMPVIRQFLTDVEDGRFDGIPKLGLDYQSLENPALKGLLQVPDAENGVVVTGGVSDPDFDSEEGIGGGDVLLSIAGHEIADDGTIELRARERTSFAYVTDLRQVGEKVSVRYLREGEPRELEIELTSARGEGKVAPRLFDRAGDFYVYGGLVFTNLTWNFVYSREWAPDNLKEAVQKTPWMPDQEIVVVAAVLSGDVNRGYEGAWGDIVESVNDRMPRNLSELAEIVESIEAPYVTFACDSGWHVTLDREQAELENPGLLERYGLTVDRSARLVRESEARRAAGGPGGEASGPAQKVVASATAAEGPGGR